MMQVKTSEKKRNLKVCQVMSGIPYTSNKWEFHILFLFSEAFVFCRQKVKMELFNGKYRSILNDGRLCGFLSSYFFLMQRHNFLCEI